MTLHRNNSDPSAEFYQYAEPGRTPIGNNQRSHDMLVAAVVGGIFAALIYFATWLAWRTL